jgi:signal transduction histidine kinase
MPAATIDQRLPPPGTNDELADLAAAFNELLSRVQDAFERQRRFTSEASHQLRTPLTALLGQVEVALRQERPAGEYRQALERAQRQGRKLAQIAEMLLFLARADREAKVPELETVDFGTWLRAQVAQWSAHPRASDLVLEIPADPLPARIHPTLLGQLLDNLLENACKYSRPGTPITLRAAALHDAEGQGQVALEVEDRGIGIPASDLPDLFEPFFRSTQARRLGVDGVGLGLALVKRIATALRGTVEARSQLGQGSTFRVRLPVASY